MATFTKIFHPAPYEALSPLSESNKHRGRTVLITGGSEGIGFEIATAFQAAEVSHVILLGRRQEALQSAVERLGKTAGSTNQPQTIITPKVCDITSKDAMESLWDEIAADDITVDILVLNAAATTIGPLSGNLLAAWGSFETNIWSNMIMTDSFMNQPHESSRSKVLLNISSFMAHTNPAPHHGAYSASKAGFSSLLQHLADEVSVENLQIISLHPGAVLTEAARRNGNDENTISWDKKELPGHFCVWAASPSAKFLHGKFVWSNWDVNELAERSDEIVKTPGMLRIGLQGSEIVDFGTVFDLMKKGAQ